MKVTGFTFIRNAELYDYPVIEAIKSILPLCDNFVVAVGSSNDNTRKLIESIDPQKIKIVDTVWDDAKRSGGKVLAEETNKALDAIDEDSDWCFYIQGDEVLHEKYHDSVRESMSANVNDPAVDGLLFDYLHFYGSYDFVGNSRKWYRSEVRIIRNKKGMRSFRDAQGFRMDGQLLTVRRANACIYHYGWVKHPSMQQAKQQSFNKYWHDDNWVQSHIGNESEFDYSQIDSLKHFEGTHPVVMQARVETQNWKFDFDPTKKNLNIKNRMLHLIEAFTGWRLGEYKNYREIRSDK